MTGEAGLRFHIRQIQSRCDEMIPRSWLTHRRLQYEHSAMSAASLFSRQRSRVQAPGGDHLPDLSYESRVVGLIGERSRRTEMGDDDGLLVHGTGNRARGQLSSRAVAPATVI